MKIVWKNSGENMPVINELHYFREDMAYLVESAGYEKYDEGFVETSSKILGVVITSFKGSCIVYTALNLKGEKVFSREFVDVPEFPADDDADILEYINSKKFLEKEFLQFS